MANLEKWFEENISTEKEIPQPKNPEEKKLKNMDELKSEVINYDEWFKWEKDNDKQIPYKTFKKLQIKEVRILELENIKNKNEKEITELEELKIAVKFITRSKKEEYSTFDKIYSIYDLSKKYCIKRGKNWLDWLDEVKNNIPYYGKKERS